MTQHDEDIQAKAIERVHLLVAEDNPLNQELVRCYIEEIGCSLDLAEDGIEAIRLFQINRYDLVFLDCQMPKLDGFDTARQIRQFEQLSAPRNMTPIIALTANSDESDRDDCLAAGMNEWLTKPFTVDQLRSTLEQWVGADEPRKTASPASAGPDREGTYQEENGADHVRGSIDVPTLDAIRALETSENPNILFNIIETYIASATDLLGRLAQAAESGDATTMSAIAHSLKSSSANVGAVELSETCRELEKRSRDQDLSEIPELCSRVFGEFDAVRIFLEAEVHRR